MSSTFRVWLTGANGMLGSAIARALAQRSIEFVAPSSLELDLTDTSSVRRFALGLSVDMVIHAAGRVGGIAANVADPIHFLTDNMAMGMNVVRAAREVGVSQLINIGSSCMYPKDHEDLLVEEDILAGPLEPTNEGYAIAKVAIDRLCGYIAVQDGFAYRTLIPSNLYGPGDHFGPTRSHLVASAIRKIEDARRNGHTEVEIWGDGSARREFTYVEDVAGWIGEIAAGSIDVASLPARLNVGAGGDRTVREYYEHIAEAVGYDGSFRYDVSKPVGMRRKLMDSSRATALGWHARTSLEKGLVQTVNHYRNEVST